MRAHPDEELKRDLGAYYTPEMLSELLARYAIRTGRDTVLEPSFGGGCIIKKVVGRLHDLNSANPVSQICGCDIDFHAFENLPNIVGRRYGKSGSRFVESDFLSLDLNSFLIKKFDAAIANPPYIAYRKMTSLQKQWSTELRNQLGVDGGRYAGTWYYFLLKSLQYLKDGGRIAFVLPYALIDADYAKGLREFISSNFRKSTIYAFGDRLFLDQGTRERVVILLAEGWRDIPQNSRIESFYVKNFRDFEDKLFYHENSLKIKKYLGTDIGNVKGRISNSDTNLLNYLKGNPLCIKLGSIVDIRIGLVAGDIQFFSFSRKKIDEKSINIKFFLPILRSLKNNPGITFKLRDFERSVYRNEDVYLLDYKEEYIQDPSYIDYIESYSLGLVSKNKTMQKRDVWCRVDDGMIPDVFFCYMSINGPIMVLNDGGVNSFNNIHRGYFKRRITEAHKKLISISLLTAFTQSVAELESKQYGSKTLKLEPKIYGNMPLLVPDKYDCREVHETFKVIDELLRSNDWERAVTVATGFVYDQIFPEKESEELKARSWQIRALLQSDRRGKSSC